VCEEVVLRGCGRCLQVNGSLRVFGETPLKLQRMVPGVVTRVVCFAPSIGLVWSGSSRGDHRPHGGLDGVSNAAQSLHSTPLPAPHPGYLQP
jgi:hypothetical protein